jgi:hypothetical protein
LLAGCGLPPLTIAAKLASLGSTPEKGVIFSPMEGNNMIRIVMLAAGMLVIGVAAATAQEKDCFSVTSPAQATLGSILINRCTGATWVLSRVRTNSGTLLRWFPLSTEQVEAIIEPVGTGLQPGAPQR